MDVVTYLVTRRFDPQKFGSIYSIIQTAVSIGAALGVLLAGRLFDRSGSYDLYYASAVPTVLLASALIALIPQKIAT